MGKVYFVGAGPGDPDLITVKGEQLIRKADCVIYDRLIGPELLKKVPEHCETIYVGKDPDQGGTGQSRINRLLVMKARQHRCVVRLKGGDPSLFGRLSEEMAVLKRHGIPFEIIPGVSSVWAAAGRAGIPLTDRKLSSSVAIATGHLAKGKASSVRWEPLAQGADTLVILMGRSTLPRVIRAIRKVRPIEEPIALIRWATRSDREEMIFATLGDAVQRLKDRPGFGPPMVAIVGKVVRLARSGGKPTMRELDGKRIVLTRPEEDQLDLVSRLTQLGATCVKLPTIAVRMKTFSARTRHRMIGRLADYDWIVFNSHHAVEALHRLAQREGQSLKKILRGSIVAIGPRTKRAIEALGLRVRLMPDSFSTDGIRQAFEKIPVAGSKIFIPRSDRAIGDALAEALRRRGAHVDEVALYKTTFPPISAQKLQEALRDADAITFTSASTVEGFVQAIQKAGLRLKEALNGAKVVAIGPATAKALRQAGIRRVVLPFKEWTLDGLTEAVREALAVR
jgi:uroporphyrinogen III methyltransferase/synthase